MIIELFNFKNTLFKVFTNYTSAQQKCKAGLIADILEGIAFVSLRYLWAKYMKRGDVACLGSSPFT